MGTRSGTLRAAIVPVRALDEPAREAMWHLFERHYADVTRAGFERDLAGKTDVIVARDSGDDSIQGFSTLVTYEREAMGRRVLVVFSGDTIVAPEYWGQPALQNAFGRYMTRAKLRHPFRPVYWFLISKGYKTYLLLTRNFAEHWPRHDRATPPWERALIDVLARERFGDAWRAEEGVIRFERAAGRLRAGVAAVDDGLLDTPDVRFFHHANPGHADGDELACLGKVDGMLWLRYLAKQARRRARRAVGRRRGWAAS